MQSAAEDLLTRLWVCAPLLYIGGTMAVDPAAFLRTLLILGMVWRTRSLALLREPSDCSRGAEILVRCCGLALCAAALLAMVVAR